jgi:hypothetical protein
VVQPAAAVDDAVQRRFEGAGLWADAAAVPDVIGWYRNGRAVKGTYPIELQLAFQHFGYGMVLFAGRNANFATLATSERKRFDMDAANVVKVTNHWVVMRGNGFHDAWTRGVRQDQARAQRRKRVGFV